MDEVKATPTKQAQLKDIEAVRDLFARSHDYMAQANHPGHLGMKVAEVLNFLAFQYNDFKTRGENLVKQIEAKAKTALSQVDVQAAVETTAAVLSDENGTIASGSREAEQPKA